MQKPLLVLATALVLAGCGAAPRTGVAAADAQLSHADGLLSGFSGQVASRDGSLTLRLVHQGLLSKPASFDEVRVKLPAGEVGAPVFLGADHKLYAAWGGVGGPMDYYAIGSYTGTPLVGKPLHYQLAPTARLAFTPAATTLQLAPIPAGARGPELVKL